MSFELTSIFIENIQDAIEKKSAGFLEDQLHELYPADIAQVINRLSVSEATYVYELLDEETAPAVLLELDDEKREELLAKFSAKKIAEQIDNMDSDDAADVVAELPEEIISPATAFSRSRFMTFMGIDRGEGRLGRRGSRGRLEQCSKAHPDRRDAVDAARSATKQNPSSPGRPTQ